MLPSRAVLSLDWPELARALPDRGLPRGVVELASVPRIASSVRQQDFDAMRGGATTIALAAVRAAQAADERAWCAWITPQTSAGASKARVARAPSLYAPAFVQAGVDLDRLLVVRPPVGALSRTVVKTASSGAFGLVVVDVPRNALSEGPIVTRKLALAAEEYGTTSLLLTSAVAARPVPWPVAMRLEVERRPDAIAVRVAKDRRGVASSHHVVRLAS
ncbi:MAG: hypothetical protein KIT84_25375 [Labilithrix sp.]|nr:hypothetical protein [Labilithrix sp.]MCW5814383.1 hypothetical protein [Labilithrix sp.]